MSGGFVYTAGSGAYQIPTLVNGTSENIGYDLYTPAAAGVSFVVTINALPTGAGWATLMSACDPLDMARPNWKLQVNASGDLLVHAAIKYNNGTYRGVNFAVMSAASAVCTTGNTYSIGVHGSQMLVQRVDPGTLSPVVGQKLQVFDISGALNFSLDLAPYYTTGLSLVVGTAFDTTQASAGFAATYISVDVMPVASRLNADVQTLWNILNVPTGAFLGPALVDGTMASWDRTAVAVLKEGENIGVSIGAGYCLCFLTVTTAGTLVVNTLNNPLAFDTLIALYGPTGALIEENEDFGTDFLSQVTAVVTPGMYYLLVSEWNYEPNVTITVSGGCLASGGLDLTSYAAARTAAKAAKQALGLNPNAGLITAYETAIAQQQLARATTLGVLNDAMQVSGSITVPGVVYNLGYPVSRVVRVYDHVSGELVTTVTSGSDGKFSLPAVATGEYFIVAHDFGVDNPTSIIQSITV